MSTKQQRPNFDTKILTPIFRVSYPHVFTATRNEMANGGKGRDQYDIVMMFDKKDKAALTPMYELMKKVAEFRFGAGVKGLTNPFKDGDTGTTRSGELISEKNPAYQGNIILNSWTINRPGIVNSKNEPIIDSEEIYGGCYCRAQLNAYAYEIAGNKGVSFGLLNIQKIKDGEAFGNRSRPEDAFTPIKEEESLAEETPSGMFD